MRRDTTIPCTTYGFCITNQSILLLIVHSWLQSHLPWSWAATPSNPLFPPRSRKTATRLGDGELHICIYIERDPFLSLEGPTLSYLTSECIDYLPTYLSHPIPNTKSTIKLTNQPTQPANNPRLFRWSGKGRGHTYMHTLLARPFPSQPHGFRTPNHDDDDG